MTKAKRYNKLSLNDLGSAVKHKEKISISNQDNINAAKIVVIKRDGRKEPFQPIKMRKVCHWATGQKSWMTDELIKDTEIKLHKEIHIKNMFQQLIVTAVNKISMLNPDWEDVAAKLQLMSYYKETHNISLMDNYWSMSDVIEKGLEYKIYDKLSVQQYTEDELKKIDSFIVPERDMLFNYKGLVTFYSKYCLNYTKTKKLELPQHAYMRVAMALMINENNRVERVKDVYDAISQHHYTKATPIMLNALTPGQQLSSCVLNTVSDDSHNILDTGKNLGIYSKYKGGTALDISALRAKGSYIEGTQGRSSGPVPFMKFYESIMRAWNQGGARPGACCVYFSWWHYDVFDLLCLKSNGGTDENRARGLQYGFKMNQLFIDAVLDDKEIALFDPKDTPNLIGSTGEKFNNYYNEYLGKPSIKRTIIKARELLTALFKNRSETGNIYLFHEENVNNASLLKRYIGSSNLCLSGETFIQTHKGQKKLKHIEPGDFVKSYNIETNKTEFKKVTDSAQTNPAANVMKITDETGHSIICTPDHKIFTQNRGYILAKDLLCTDQLKISEEMIETNHAKIKKSEDTFNHYMNNII